MTYTSARIWQWVGIIIIALLLGVAYWWYQSQASTLNKSPTGSLTSGLVGYWTFDGADMGSTTATDRGSGSNNGTLTNTPGRVKGLAGQALEFFPNGSDSNAYVTMGDPGDGDLDFGSGDFSVVFWMKGKGYSSQGSSVNVPVSKKNSNAGGTAGYSFRYSSANQMIFAIGNGSTDYEITAPVATVADQVWHQYIGIRSGSTAYFYIDGGLAGSIAVSGSTSNSDVFAVGDDTGTERNVNAVIDEVRVYNAALTTAQLSSLYAAVQPDKTNSSVSQSTGTGRLDSGLALYWPLDDGSGGSVTDASTNGNTGTIVNDPTWTTGQVAGALDFKGGSYVAVADPATGILDFADSTNFTLSGWFNRDTFTTDDTLIAKSNGQTASDTGYNVYIDDSTDKVTFVANDGTDQYKIESASTFTATGWHHFSLVWNDASSSETKLYINGALEAATTTGTFANVNSLANSVDFRINSESDSANHFSGKLDEMRVYSRSLSADEVGQLYRLTSPTGVDTSLKIYWSFNGQDVSGTTAYDRSGAGNTGTLTGGPTKTVGKLGQALSFDGSDDYVIGANRLNITRVTMSTWIYMTANPASDKAIASFDEGLNSGLAYDKVLYINSSGIPKFYVYDGSAKTVTSSAPIILGQWNHVVGTADGTTASLYLNGALVGSTAAGDTYALYTVPNFFVGAATGGAYGYFTGKIDEVRVYNAALTAAQIKALYDAGQSDKTNSSISQPQGTGRLDSGLAGYWALDEGSGTNANDSSTVNNAGTLQNTPTWTTGQIGSALDFDEASTEYVSISDNSAQDVVDGESFSLSGWFNRDTFTTDDPIFDKRGSLSASAAGYVVYIDDSTDKLTFEASDGTDEYQLESVSTFTSTGWNHYAIVWDDNSSTETRLYINGKAEVATATGTFGNVNSLATTATINIAYGGLSFFQFFDGKLDELRLYKRVLSSDEVSQLYRLTSPTGTDTSLKGYWSFNGQDVTSTSAYDRSGAGNTGTLNGSIAKSIGKIGQGFIFDGVNDSISMPDINAMDGVANVTLSGWFKRNAANAHLTIGKSATANQRFDINFYSDGNVYLNINDGASQQYGYFASNDTNWHHVVMVFDGSLSGNSNRLKAYLDGVATSLTFSGTVPATTHSNSDAFSVGINSVNGFYSTGKIDEVRLYNRSLTEAEAIALYNQGR